MNPAPLGKVLIITGAGVLILGIALPYLDKIPLLGKLPGDFMFRKKNFSFYFLLGTMILLSVSLSLIFCIISYLKK